MKRSEAIIQGKIIEFLRAREWFVKPTHGNMYSSGFPDIFATHHKYSHRWIEVKLRCPAQFTPAQLEVFPKLCAHGSGVWILTAATHEEYNKLFKNYNWFLYL